jgi:hypothetical protein
LIGYSNPVACHPEHSEGSSQGSQDSSLRSE